MVKDALELQKYTIMWDKHGKVPFYYNYKSNIVEFNKDIAAVSAKMKPIEEALEYLRVKLVSSMRTGDPLIIYLDSFMPDFFQEYTSDEKNFPAYSIFDFKEWREYNNYIKIVRDEENVDLVGNRPHYIMC